MIKKLTILLAFIFAFQIGLTACSSGSGRSTVSSVTSATESEISEPEPEPPLDSVAKDEGEIKYVAPNVEYYYNYIELKDNSGKLYRIGDPYVLRYNGKYYLYPSVSYKNNGGGIPMWISDNMVDWTFDRWILGTGSANSGADEVYAAYAPEVVYYNGYFYMCESQRGNGHYIFRSTAPDGDYTLCSDNLGLGIDGHMVVTDDNRLVIITASGELCIAYYELFIGDNGWVTAGTGTRMPQIWLNGWTEAPATMERDGYKYLTYSGNHVNHPAYRLAYAYTQGQSVLDVDDLTVKDNPVYLFSTGEDTPYTGRYGYNSGSDAIVLSNYRGLGHNGNAVGPDLDSLFCVYHNAGRYDYNDMGVSVDFDRRYNITRYYTNLGELTTNGYCLYNTPKPTVATFTANGNSALSESGNYRVSSAQTADVYTAEINLKLSENSGRAVVSYVDYGNYIAVNMSGDTLSVIKCAGGTESVLASSHILVSANANAYHTVKVINGNDKSSVYYDGVLKISLDRSLGGAGKIGVLKNCTAGSVQFSNDAYGTSDFEAVKNVGATFPSYSYLKTENRGYSLVGGTCVGVRQGEKESTKKVITGYDKKGKQEAGMASVTTPAYEIATVLGRGEWLKYAVNAEKDGTYSLNLKLSKESMGCQFDVIVDEHTVYHMSVPEITFGDTDYLTVCTGTFDMRGGIHSLKIRVLSGKLEMTQITVLDDATAVEFTNPLTDNFSQGKFVVGQYTFASDGLHSNADSLKSLYYFGNKGVADCEFSVDLTIKTGSAGFLIRGHNFSYCSRQPDAPSGYEGYWLDINASVIILRKVNYAQTVRCAYSMAKVDGDYAFANNRKNSVRVVCFGNNIKVYLNGKAIINYSDVNSPYTNGYFGLYSEKGEGVYYNLRYSAFKN